MVWPKYLERNIISGQYVWALSFADGVERFWNLQLVVDDRLRTGRLCQCACSSQISDNNLRAANGEQYI